MTSAPARLGAHASITAATMRRESHSPQARSGGSTRLICRSVNALAIAAPRDRAEPRVGTTPSSATDVYND